ncbi:hypothetical protein J1N35_038916 [Gossypium stocksii]|uniref:PWWP domain-containing protein n=1 Tax=Gossypium stocksii TaxID=47602 RepID=A0A9D3UMT5_9ROSI|nr:hypothetical protein J1N35_038916 [Gossypium stocksii]
MGSPDEPNIKGIDASVGGLVWVRRRNGSWWPGRIMGLDELSEGYLVSPRSGTPVKLLGREDASVDWYNLEKSKRVKAFRCGEYNECIEKAKASAANSSKKAVKYARREDAILHALEIESARLGKDHPDYFSRKDRSGGDQGCSAKESRNMSRSGKENDDEMSGSEDGSNSAPELSQSGLSFEETNLINGTKGRSMLVKRRKTPNDSEDDGAEGIKRMKGLEDLGMGVGSKRKAQATGVLESVQQENASFCGPNTNNCLSNGGPINGSRNHSSSLKRKRSQVANVHEFLKRKNRRRPLTKVLESTAMVSVPVSCDELPSSSSSPLRGLSDSKVSGMDSNESRKSISAVINNSSNNNNNNSDSTGISCENGVSLNVSEHAADADASQTNNKTKDKEIFSVQELAENESSDRLFDVPFFGEDKPSADFSPIFVSCSSETPEVGNLGREAEMKGHNESGYTRSVDVQTTCISQRIEKGTAEWQLKGKRKSRQISEKQRHNPGKHADMVDEPNTFLASTEHFDGFSLGSNQKVDFNGVDRSGDPYTCIFQSKSKSVVEDQLNGFGDWKAMSRQPHGRGPIVEAKVLPDSSGNPQRSLPYRQSRYTVNPRYQTTDFPGKTYSADSSLYDIKIDVKANYRPQHVPLVSLMSKLNGKAIIGHPLTVEVLNDDYYDNPSQEAALECTEVDHSLKQNSGGRVPRKRIKLQSQFPPRKSAKVKKSGLLSKKIRKLSSLTGQKLGVGFRKPVAEKPKGAVIACIPLKLVFSRINEALNGSARPTHRSLTSSNS